MNDLISIQTDKAGIQTVNARDLHRYLESKQNFADWIKGRIEEYGFIEGVDFIIILGKSIGGRPPKEYHISINMAKELSMVEHNEKGQQARRYFLECERRVKDPMVFLNDPVALRSALLTYSEKVLALETKVETQAVKVEALDRIASADGSMCGTDAAKHLQVRPSDLFRFLVYKIWIYKRSGSAHYTAYQKRIQQGLLIHKVTIVPNGDGTETVRQQMLITPKGIAKLSEIMPGNRTDLFKG